MPSFTVETPLSFQCSRSDPLLTGQGAVLAHLDSLPPYDWCSGQTALFLFLSEKAVLAYLPTALSAALRPLFPFQQARYVQVFQLKSGPFSKLFAGLGITDKSAISLLFSSYLTLVLSSIPCSLLHLFFYLNLSGRSGRNCLLSPPVLSSYNGFSDTRFSRDTTWLTSWPYGKHYSCPMQSLVVSLVLSLVFTLLFSRDGGVLSHLISLTHKFPRFPPNLCSLVTLAVLFLVIVATDTASYQVRILLGLAESKILFAAPADTRPRTLLILFCNVQLRTVCASCSLVTLYLFTTSGQA